MIIRCNSCNRKFKIEESRINPAGSKVRCSKCGHIFFVERPGGSIERGTLTDKADSAASDINIESDAADIGVTDNPSDRVGKKNTDYSLEEPGPLAEERGYRDQPSEHDGHFSDEDILDPDIDKTTSDEGNWEEFVSISKAVAGREDKETDNREKDFNWENLSIDDEWGASHRDIPEMFEDEGGGSSEELSENSASRGKEESTGPPSKEISSEKLILDTDDLSQSIAREEDFGRSLEGTYHEKAGIYRPDKKSKGRTLSKIAYALMTAVVLVVIVTAGISILVNLDFIPEESVTKARTFVLSLLPITLSQEPARDIIITQHKGHWIDTRNGPLYVVSGMIKNKSENPVHYIKIKSEFISAGQTLFEDTVYAGNTFSENELKVSRLEDIMLKLKKKNGDIDYYNTNKLAGLNYNVQPGESIPFFAVFPHNSTVLGLKYNLKIVNFEDSSIN